MAELNWIFVVLLGATGIGMALLSALVGMRSRVENPAWWLLYAIWILLVLRLDAPRPFWTLLLASVLAGLLHGSTISLLLDSYIAHNPWYAEQMKASRARLIRQFVLMGLGIGALFGAFVGGIAWALERYLP